MAKKIIFKDPFKREYSMTTIRNNMVERGDIIKISGEHGIRFKFDCLVTNPKNGIQWIDCFEIQKGVAGPSRSFYPERVVAALRKDRRVKRA